MTVPITDSQSTSQDPGGLGSTRLAALGMALATGVVLVFRRPDG